MNNDTSSLGVISPELIIQILHYCEYPSILTFAATCKTYYELVTQSTSLQLHIELEANGMELVKGSFQGGATYSIILDDIKRFRDAWLDLNLAEPVQRSVGKSGMLLWELREGFYIKAFSRSEGMFSDALQFVPLDSKIPDPPPLTFNFVFNEFTADPGQGLLAILSRDPGEDAKVHVHLYSSATGLPHPLARYPRLTAEFDFEPPYFWPGFSIEIMGDVVLSKVSLPQTHIYELLIWDWRCGALLQRISSRGGICDYTFLDQRHLVVLSGSESDQGNLNTLSILIYALPDNASTRAARSNNELVRVVDFPISQPILRLQFPAMKERSQLSGTGFFLRSDPTPGRRIYTNTAAFSCPCATTLSMTFQFRNSEAFGDWESPPYYRIFLDGRFLIEQVHKSSGDENKEFPWSSWGTRATRWFVGQDEPGHWISWMSGSRFILPFSDQPYYCIFDFSPQTVRRFRDRFAQSYPTALDNLVDDIGLATTKEFHDLGRLEADANNFCERASPELEFFAVTVDADNPSVIDSGKYSVFEESITSQLPYRLIFPTQNRRYPDGWQLNGDCIVGVSTRDGLENLSIYKLKK